MLSPRELEQFKEILARGLNTASPEKYPEWYALADKLLAQEEADSFLRSDPIR